MRHTLLSLVGISQLLEPTANLLGSPMFAGLFEDIFRYEAVPVGKSTEGFGGSRVGGLIAGEAFGREG